MFKCLCTVVCGKILHDCIFGKQCKMTVVNKLICKMVKKKLKGEIRNQHNLKIILPGQLVQRRVRSNSTSYMYQRYIIHFILKNDYQNFNPFYLYDMCSNWISSSVLFINEYYNYSNFMQLNCCRTGGRTTASFQATLRGARRLRPIKSRGRGTRTVGPHKQ